MRRGWMILISLLAAGALATGIGHQASAQEPPAAKQAPVAKEAPVAKGLIIGSDGCKMCHQTEKSGKQYSIWAESKHAQAFAVLASDKAKEIAKAKGIADAQKAPECLVCHSTRDFLGAKVALDPKTKFTPAEGVGCEACHGAGSEYKTMSIMKDRAKSVPAGLLIPSKDTCLACHNEKSPTYKPFKFEERVAQIAHPVPKATK